MIKVMNMGIMNMDHQLNIKTFIFNSFRENCYLLWDAVGNCVIVDPGCYWPEEFSKLREFIAAEGLKRFDGVKYGYRTKEYEGLHNMYKKTRSEGFGAEVKRRIMLGSFVLSSGYYDAYYLKALRTKALIKREFDRLFEKYDLILGP